MVCKVSVLRGDKGVVCEVSGLVQRILTLGCYSTTRSSVTTTTPPRIHYEPGADKCYHGSQLHGAPVTCR